MSWSGKLAECFIQFTTTGVDVFQKGLDQVRGGLEKVTEGANKAAAVITSAFNKAALTLGGLVTAGIAASSWGQQFGFYMERLSRVVAGLFGPEIQKVLGWLRELTNRLASLSDAQRAQIVRWAEAAAAMFAVAVVLPKIVGGVNLVIGAVRALTAALVGSGWGAFLVAAGALATVFLSVGAGAEVLQGGLGRLWKAVQPLLDGFMKLGAQLMKALEPILALAVKIFEGVVAAIVKAGPTVEQWIGQLAGSIEKLARGFSDLEPLIAAVFEGWLKGAMEVLPPMADLAESLARIAVDLGRVVAIFEGLPKWVKMLAQAAVEATLVVTQLKLMAYALHEIADLIGWITGEEFDERKMKLKIDTPKAEPGRGEAPKKVGGQEQFAALWDRLALASRNMGQSPEEKALTWLEKIFGKAGEIANGVKNIKPDIRNGGA
jgi:hypothetical protein